MFDNFDAKDFLNHLFEYGDLAAYIKKHGHRVALVNCSMARLQVAVDINSLKDSPASGSPEWSTQVADLSRKWDALGICRSDIIHAASQSES